MKTVPRRPQDPAGLIPIRDDPAYAALLADIQDHEKRLAEARRRKEQAEAELRGATPKRDVDALAQQLVAGGMVRGSSPQQQIQDAETEIAILWQSYSALAQRLAALDGDLSWAACQAVKAEHDQALRDVLAAIAALREAMERAFAVRARVRGLGYSVLHALLPDLAPHYARLLGDPDAVGASNAWFFKAELQKRGII